MNKVLNFAAVLLSRYFKVILYAWKFLLDQMFFDTCCNRLYEDWLN